MANRPGSGRSDGQPRPVPLQKTRHTKQFDLGGGRRRIVVSERPLHWGADLKEIDLTPREQGNRFVVDQADYIFTAFKTGRFLYESRSGGTYELRMRDLGGPLNLNPTIGEKQIRFDDIRPGLDLVYELRPTGMRMIRFLKSDLAPRTMVFRVFESNTRQFEEKGRLWGWDSKHPRMPARRPLNLDRSIGNERPAGSRMRYDVTETWTGEAGEIVDPSTRRREWQTDIVYPVVIYG